MFFSALRALALALALAALGISQTLPIPKEPPPRIAPNTISFGEWKLSFVKQEIQGSHYKLTGSPGLPAEVLDERMLFRADEIDYDSDTGIVLAKGHVYFKHFEKNEQIWASHLEYDTEEETGKFYDVRGVTQPRLVTRPGILSVNTPFYFEGEWAERLGVKYILYNGWVTNCKVPKPWWRLRGKKFDIIPHQRTIAHNSIFLLRGLPLLYLPWFYHNTEKEPRKSGFLSPVISPFSRRGFMIGLGYYWAISRSYDVAYSFEDFTKNAFSHHVDFRGQPRPGTDFDAIFYGVQDNGDPSQGPNPPTYSGVNLYAVGRSDLGHGWYARGYVNYISSFRFRQNWSQSFSEGIGSEIRSVGFLHKDWQYLSADLTVSRLQNFETAEQPFTDPVTGKTSLVTNAVTIRKLPEAEVAGRDQQLWQGVPLWFSYDSSAGFLFRSEPFFDQNNALISRFETKEFTPRLHMAPHVTGAFHFGSFNLIPSLGFQETFYGEGQGPDPLHPGLTRVVGTDLVRSARDFSLDLVFPSLERVFQKKTVFGDKLKHVIEPRVTYLYMTGIGQDFNRFIRFDSTDLLSNTNELALSLTNRIYAKRGDSVQEIFTWELTQKRYFDPTFGGALVPGVRNIFASTADLSGYAFLVGPRSTSPVASLLRTSPVGGLGFQWQADFDPRYNKVVDSSFTVDYHWQKYFFALGNNQVHTNPDLVHTNPDLGAPIANQFHFHTSFGDANRRGLNTGFDVNYDYRAHQVQFATSQITYNTDCCGISVQYRRYSFGLRNENQMRIAFSIANLGTLGTLRKQDRIF